MPWLERAFDVPGAIADALYGHAAVPASIERVDPADVAEEVARSPRANGYLALEPGLDLLRVGGRLFGVAARGRSAFVAGGLLGAAGDGVTGALIELRERLRAGGFRRVFLVPVSLDEAAAVEAAGFESADVASEAILSVRSFSLAGKARADLRQMCNRAAIRHGLVVRELDPEREASRFDAVYRAWLARRPKGHQMRLLVGTPQLTRPLGRRYFGAVVGSSGEPVAVITITPGWSRRGWGIDVMARHPSAPSGAMELLVTKTVESLAREGCELLSLGAAPMAPTPGRGPRGSWPVRCVVRVLYGSWLGRRLFGFRGLHHFKAKFAPAWRPVLLATWPRATVWSMYVSARMWGMFGPPPRPR